MKRTLSILLLTIMIAPAFVHAQDVTVTAVTDPVATTPTQDSSLVLRKKSEVKQQQQKSSVQNKKKKSTKKTNKLDTSTTTSEVKYIRKSESNAGQNQQENSGPKLPALELTSDQLSCLKSALQTKNDSQLLAHSTTDATLKSGWSTWLGAVVAAYGQTGDTQKTALEAAQKALNETRQNALKAEQATMKTVNETFKNTVKDTCKINGWPDQGASAGKPQEKSGNTEQSEEQNHEQSSESKNEKQNKPQQNKNQRPGPRPQKNEENEY